MPGLGLGRYVVTWERSSLAVGSGQYASCLTCMEKKRIWGLCVGNMKGLVIWVSSVSVLAEFRNHVFFTCSLQWKHKDSKRCFLQVEKKKKTLRSLLCSVCGGKSYLLHVLSFQGFETEKPNLRNISCWLKDLLLLRNLQSYIQCHFENILCAGHCALGLKASLSLDVSAFQKRKVFTEIVLGQISPKWIMIRNLILRLGYLHIQMSPR